MSVRKTHEQFVDELQAINPCIKVLGRYITATTKIQVRCEECGNIWDTMPSTLLCGRGCPECGKKKVSAALRKSNQEFTTKLSAVNPDIIPIKFFFSSN